jgi:hypothetical protein
MLRLGAGFGDSMGSLHQIQTAIELPGTNVTVCIQTHPPAGSHQYDNDIYFSLNGARVETSMSDLETFAKRVLAAIALHRSGEAD